MMAETVGADAGDNAETQALLVRLFAGVLMAGFVMAFSLAISSGYGFDAFQRIEHDVSTAHWVLLLAAVPALLLLGPPVLRSALADLRDRRLTLNVLFALGTSSAVAVSAVSYLRGTGPIYLETAVMLLALYTLGRYLTARTKGTTARVMRRLLDVPDTTYRRLSPNAGDVAADALRVGDRIRIRAGDVLPVDGTITEGRSYMDTSRLTGEAQPAVKKAGDAVFAGTSALDGALTVEVTAVADDRRLARVEAMMREALARPPRLARRIDRIMRWLIPGVVVLALATFVLWWHLAGFARALYVALSVVVITCPCALGIAIPLTLVRALKAAVQRGVLVRSGRALLDLAKVEAVAFDKTGTLSALAAPTARVVQPKAAQPKPVSAGTAPPPAPEADTLLRRAAAVEQGTRHALADAIVRAARERGLDVPEARDVQTISGAGVVGRVDDAPVPHRVAVGNRALLDALDVACPPRFQEAFSDAIDAGETPLFVAEDGVATALLVLAEKPAPHAADAVAALQDDGAVVRILTGDRATAARRLADRLSLDADAALSPGDKVTRLQLLRDQHGPMAMVGDGINDAAALADADVGIALASGASVALEAADVTIYPDDLRLVPWLQRLARRTDRIIRQNLWWTAGYNAVGLGLAVAGLLHPIVAVVIMTLSSLVVTGNALRIRSEP
jgi:heavy metal translocating P-type ATPase